jgi:hypothetical protein
MDIIEKIEARIVQCKAATLNIVYQSTINDFSVDLTHMCVNGNEVQAAVRMQVSVFAYQVFFFFFFPPLQLFLFWVFVYSCNILEGGAQAFI